MPDSDRDDAALVRITSYCPDSENPAAACGTDRLERLASGYELRARLRRYAVDERIGKCGRVVHMDPHVLTEETEDGGRRARWTGLCLCNRSGCAVCGAVKCRRFHDDVLRAVSSGGHWQHVVMTVPHRACESWETVYARVLDGIRQGTKGIVGRLVSTVVEATVRATESTWSVRSGWHVHFHVLWKCTRPLLDAEKRIAQVQWRKATNGDPRYDGLQFGAAFDCSLEGERRKAAGYIAKLAAEMSGVGKAAHPEHWTLGELYRQAATGDGRYVALVREYQSATKGKRLYQLDRRAAQLRDDAPPLPELRVVRAWTTRVDRAEFRQLAKRERIDPLALYLPLEVAARARGDPWEDVEQTIGSLVAPVFVRDEHLEVVRPGRTPGHELARAPQF